MESALPFWRQHRIADAARLRIALTYLWRHRRIPDLANPATFTELVQHRKLHDHDARMPAFADKVVSKQIVAELIGREWIIPTLWHGVELPLGAEWATPFIVKSRHGCNQYAVVFTGDENWQKVRRKAKRWMQSEYGFWLDEWLYKHIPRGILVEPFIGQGRTLPIDYKFHVFGGRVEFVQVHLDRGGRHRWILFNRAWQRVSSRSSDVDPAPPNNLARMMAAAEELGRSFEFVRVDMYEVNDKPYFGEMTFYPGSGLDRFHPVSLDAVIGKYWLHARQHIG